jgi:hypothetical protein
MKIGINSEDSRVPPGRKVNLKKWQTHVAPVYKSKRQYHKPLEAHAEELSLLQHLHYASNHYALLLIFQGMDAAGKDGAIRHVMYGVNPQGGGVFSFKQPSAEEREDDFLWRTACRLPERGGGVDPVSWISQRVRGERREECTMEGNHRAGWKPEELAREYKTTAHAVHDWAHHAGWTRVSVRMG